MKGIPEATPIILTEEERAELEALVRSTKTEYRMCQRARIVLLAASGMKTRAIGWTVDCTTGTASKWRVRYAAQRLAGLDETGDRGAEPKYTAETDRRILAVLDRPVPAGHARWTGPLIAAALKFPNGRALNGHSHDYKRHGTSTLFAALEVATGRVMTVHKRCRRRIEFLDFMNDIVALYPDTAIHVVLDNLNTHKPKNDRWLKRHPNVQFHFTPTRASWLNQVEIWFSILQGNSLKDASFISVKQLREHIDAFIEDYNEHAKPFAWTKSQVHQKRLKTGFADQ
jgi:transposase